MPCTWGCSALDCTALAAPFLVVDPLTLSNLVKRRQHIVLEDLEDFLSEPQAAAAWEMLDEDKDGQVNVQVHGWAGGWVDRPGQAGCEGSCSAADLNLLSACTLACPHPLLAPACRLACPPQECCVAIAKVFVDRRNLAASLKDARSIVGKLESVIGIMLHIIMGGWLRRWW